MFALQKNLQTYYKAIYIQNVFWGKTKKQSFVFRSIIIKSLKSGGKELHPAGGWSVMFPWVNVGLGDII